VIEVLRGGLYFAHLPGVGDKPVLVVSWNALNVGLRSPVVCRVTRPERERRFPTYVQLSAGEGGLPDDSYVLCHDLTTLRTEDLRRQIGILPVAAMRRVELALRRALDLG
jgi:mRNA-degrading endonuclease toxin of MazEF toxin-antitoxin module